MTDYELLELAARVAEFPHPIVYEGDEEKGWGPYVKIGKRQYWRPLDDDGDALRLAHTAHVHITQVKFGARCLINIGFECIEQNESDPMAATRRAIVRAAVATLTSQQTESTQGSTA